MKLNRYILNLVIIGSLLVANMPVNATEIILNSVITSEIEQENDVQTLEEIFEQQLQKETAQRKSFNSIEFKKEEYVRITQPVQEKGSDYITTFDSQINMMGEARYGTQITIDVFNDDELYKSYEIDAVGATQTFNQLINLGEKDNIIVISYSHEEDGIFNEEFQFLIFKEPQENKERLKSYVVSTPQDLPQDLLNSADIDDDIITMSID